MNKIFGNLASRNVTILSSENFQSSIERIGADPLDYWRRAANSKSYPNLQKLAIIYLSAPPSSAESERAVSRLAEIESIKGANSSVVSDQQAKAQMFLHFNYDN